MTTREAQPVPAAHPHGRSAARRARRVHAGVGAAAAHRRAPAGQRLRADRRRAALARRHAARLDQDSRRRKGRRRSDAADAGADREPAARRSLADRRGRRIPAADRRSSSCRTARSPDWSVGTGRPSRTCSGCSSSRPKCRRWCTRASSPKAMRGRCSVWRSRSGMIALARQAVEQGWSVREMEARVRGDVPAAAGAADRAAPRRARPRRAHGHRRRARGSRTPCASISAPTFG